MFSAFFPANKRIAILDFDYAAVLPQIAPIFGSNVNIGRGFADLLADRLERDGDYTVIDPKEVSRIVAELNFSDSERSDAIFPARIGKLLGADAVVTGSIDTFGRDTKSLTGSAGAIGGSIVSTYGPGAKNASPEPAVVRVTARVIDTNTDEVLAVADGRGESRRRATSLTDGKSSPTDMTSSNFARTIIGEATEASVADVAAKLHGATAEIRVIFPRTIGLITAASADTVTINVGSRSRTTPRVGAECRVFLTREGTQDVRRACIYRP